jgi:ABC-type polysaccharide/polyol phosphate transport system ATPase subunit
MAEPHVHFESVWKKFQRGEHHDTLRDAIIGIGRRLAGRRPPPREADEFWAVRDVSFDVRPGETLGIIGGNGAGKSTILKLLTRIMRPNRGRLHVEGRVGALIEVSAGFHPDLTGRENIFLQGSLMGMRNATIQQRFDEIVEFSGISEFLDTPVKRYSSGMNARLGFSIAAHLDPEVLIIDEVLAVGDFRFQQKAFGRLQELASSGKPVIVVSHQLDRISELCSKAILLNSGRVVVAGSTAECIATYLGQAGASATGNEPISLTSPVLTPSGPLSVGDGFHFSVHVVRRRELPADTILGVRVRTLNDNTWLFATTTFRQGIALPDAREFTLRAELRAHLIPGRYVIDAYAADPKHPTDVWASPGLSLHVSGPKTVFGRAHLGGAIAITSCEEREAGAGHVPSVGFQPRQS